ncbi:phospho-sugar mutase [Aquisalibacillus elongatus]|uniref:Phosphoglucomutase n=1 Tax=Aquisalibacillus elongatus TaxID=485577 RepID=A0A3N5BB96_9BACI|nr:phospho-sugar mutase [Aquisalibacillus elongatus]RPF54219.1 alpha-phosphoglucomutase [Aquisalibacillus elongatus]
MSWEEDFERWNNKADLDSALKHKLLDMKEDELEEAFHKTLEFGTGGMRGVLGPGTNRMNIYTVRKVAKGLASYIESQSGVLKEQGVVVAYDSRYMSKEFAIETAKVLGVHNIPTYVFTSLRPTPELSFAVRHLGTAAGVMITASHNPPEYNGYKVYNETGGQLPPKQADEMIAKVNAVEDELEIDVVSQQELEDAGLLRWVDEGVDQAYLEELKSITFNSDVIRSHADKLGIVFTPLHGTANEVVQAGLKQVGFSQVHVVEEQAKADPEFSTVKSPNPEEHQAFELAIEKGEAVQADILVGTDPDADRLGVAVKDESGEYKVLTGNQLGALMLDYILSNHETLPENPIMIKTIVTSELGRAVADDYGVETLDVLTGFKFISEKIEEFNQQKTYQFMFGYEESYGYLIKDFSRDKDAVQSTVLACEMAAFYRSQGKTLFDALDDLYQRLGYYIEDLHSLKLEGLEGSKQIDSIMQEYRESRLEEVAGLNVKAFEDYDAGKRTLLPSGETEDIDLPKSNVVKFKLEQDCWFCLRPSGTEPKLKFYFGVKGETYQDAEKILSKLKSEVLDKNNVTT